MSTIGDYFNQSNALFYKKPAHYEQLGLPPQTNNNMQVYKMISKTFSPAEKKHIISKVLHIHDFLYNMLHKYNSKATISTQVKRIMKQYPDIITDVPEHILKIYIFVLKHAVNRANLKQVLDLEPLM